MAGRTLYDKVWEQHVVKAYDDGSVLLYDNGGYDRASATSPYDTRTYETSTYETSTYGTGTSYADDERRS